MLNICFSLFRSAVQVSQYLLFFFYNFSENVFPFCLYNKIQAQVLRIFVRFKLDGCVAY